MKTRYWNPYLGGLALGVVLFLSFVVSGHGLGASGGLARFLAAAGDLVASEHVNRSVEWASMAGGSRNALDHWLVFAVLGTATGGFASGLLAKRIRVETFKGPHIGVRTRWLMAFGGGALVGFAAKLARGCTSGQALSGGATLAVGSWAFMLCVFGGGYALAYFVRRLWN